MKSYKIKLFSFVVLYIIIYVIGYLLHGMDVENEVAIGYGLVCTISALFVPLYVIKTMGIQRSLLCIVAGSAAPIWFLYLEGLLEKEATASILEPYMRIKAYSIAVLYQAFYILSYIFFISILDKFSVKLNKKLEKIELKVGYIAACTIFACLLPLIIIGSRYASLDELWSALTAGRQGSESGTLLRRSAVGGDEALLLPLMWLWQLTPSLAALTLCVNLQKNLPLSILTLAACLFGIAVTFFTFLGGSRGGLMFVIAVPMMLWFYYGIKFGMKFWVVTIVIFFLFIGIMEFQVKTRGNMLDQLNSSRSDVETEISFNPLKTHRDNNLYFLSLAVDGVPDNFPYEGYGDFFALLANPIPRAIWPSKPLLSGALGKSEAKPVYASGPLIVGTSSLTSSIVGQSYLWGGVLAFAPVVIIFGAFSVWFDSWFMRMKEPNLIQIAIQGFAAFMIFWGFRGFGAFIAFIYPFAVLYIVFLVVGSLQNGSQMQHKKMRV